MAGGSNSRETLRNPSRGAGAELPRVPSTLVRLLSADAPGVPSSRHFLEDIDSVRIFRGPAGVAARARTLEVAIDDPYASANHALLRLTPGEITIRDEGSSNGTYVEGEPLRPGEDRPVRNALIEVGRTFFVLRDETVGARESPTMQDAAEPLTFHAGFAEELRRAARLARRSHDLLVIGESGAGKEVTARWLHQQSGRSGPLVAVNCAALPEHLLEDELFGHVKGAFSGAQSDRTGLIRAAHTGALLLDEVGEMSPALQAKLLRMLESRRVRPLGGESELPVDTLVIAATHRDLRTMVDEGQFRQDLHARLGLLTVRIPPVRERREDLGLLIRSLLTPLPAGVTSYRFELETLRGLLLHDWPMNVRELRKVLLAAVDLATPEGGGAVVIGPEHVPDGILGSMEKLPLAASPLSTEDEELRERLSGLLVEHRGNLAAVAREMEKSRIYVQRLMARFGLRRPGH
ncbi:MAG TPA: sigma 54-interacting transcriptional regulator [Myxococcaceae bacterium]|nr:sigma 54-interacting transcriptional regulator [Myxococcaceae bacterium]